MNPRIAVYYNDHLNLDQVTQQIAPFTTADEVKAARFFSSYGNSMIPLETFKPAASIFAPLDRGFSRAFIFRQALLLPVGPGLLSVLGQMLVGMGEGSEIYIHSPVTGVKTSQWITADDLRSAFPSATVETEPRQVREWLRIGWGHGIDRDVARLPSIYLRLAHRAEEFYRQLETVIQWRWIGWDRVKACGTYIIYRQQLQNVRNAYYRRSVAQALNLMPEINFVYSLQWALIAGDVMREIFAVFDRRGPMIGMDIGGSHGFFACQLAMFGHTVTNYEALGWEKEQVQQWMIDACGVKGRVFGRAGRMEKLYGKKDSLDFICIMNSLLCAERDAVPRVLSTAMSMLKPGGLLVVRDNLLPEGTSPTFPKGRNAPGAKQFGSDEFRTYLTAIGEPRYFDIYAKEYPAEALGRSLTIVFAAIQKA